MSKINYICFDIGGVANDPRKFKIVQRAQECWGSNFSEERFSQMINPSVSGRNCWREFQNGKLSAVRYIDLSLEAVNLDLTQENRNFFRQILEEWCGEPYQPVLDLVRRLNKGGYYTSVLSNNNEIMYNTPGAEIKNHVHLSLSSHLIGFSKPDPGAFRKLLWVTGSEPSRMIFVDDQDYNVDSAEYLGIHGFHFRSKELGMDKAFEELMVFLKEKGIEI